MFVWDFFQTTKEFNKTGGFTSIWRSGKLPILKKKEDSFFITNQSKTRYRKPYNSRIACTSSIHVNSYAYDEIQHNKHSRLLTTDLVMLL